MRQEFKNRKNISFKRALYWILVSTCLVSGTSALMTLYFFHIQEIRLQSTRFNLKRIAQKSKNRVCLPTDYLAEVLGLSEDVPTNLGAFATRAAQKKLHASPVIRKAKVEKLFPDTLMIDYHVRNPQLRLIDFENAAIDRYGVLFPLTPFFPESFLPELKLGRLKKNIIWGDMIDDEQRSLAFEILDETIELDLLHSLQIIRIDLSKMDNPSLGAREIVLMFQNKATKSICFLRCGVDELKVQLSRFARLIPKLKTNHWANAEENSATIIDFRVPRLAFIENMCYQS